MDGTMLENALVLASHGFFVHPLRPNSKLPALKKWEELASCDPEQVKRLFAAVSPNCNIGAQMGRRAGRIGLDIDYDDGADPEFLKRLPVSWTVKSGKGHHWYGKMPAHWPDFGIACVIRGNKPVDPDKPTGKKKPCVTIRCNNHQFALPPSIHPETGKHYEWAKYEGWDDRVSVDILSPDEVPLAEAPEWLLEALQETAAEPKLPGQKYYENERHAMFVATATRMRKEGRGYQEIVDRILERNAKDCVPPKPSPDVEKEAANVATWVMKTVIPDRAPMAPSELHGGATTSQPTAVPTGQPVDLLTQFVHCLGFLDKDYFYLSVSNKQLTRISATGHSSGALMNLMPLDFWWEMFPGKNTPNWDKAASHLMETCRKKGIFNAKRIRGAGAWNDSGSLVIHLGDRLLVDGVENGLLDYHSRNSYRLGPEYPMPGRAATTADCLCVLRSAEAPLWQKPSSSILFAGHLALLRVSGALPWRPHGWLTGPAGCGKSTIMKHLVNTVGGEWACIPQADTSSSGIRQQIEVDSRPVLFDEIEAEDKKASARVKGVIELARQASSDTEGRIFKGTPDGRGLEYKVNSMFIVASIGASLTQEADLTRFCMYELERVPAGADAMEFVRRLEALTPELADALFARSIALYPVILANYAVLQKVVASRSSQRHGQQYGMLLAGYWSLVSEAGISQAEAKCLADRIDLHERTSEAIESNQEESCLLWLSQSVVRHQMSEREQMQDVPLKIVLDRARSDREVASRMQHLGLRLREDGLMLYVANQHPVLEKLFSNTAWDKKWKTSLARLPGSVNFRARFGAGHAIRCVGIPIESIFPSSIEHVSSSDDGIQ